MGARRGGISPDTALEISLNGTAARLHHEGLPAADIIAELRRIANGRADLLAKAAATHLGGWLAAPGMSHPATVTIAGYLVQAGADPETITAAVDQTRKNASGSDYSL
jgi:hypothetical protein